MSTETNTNIRITQEPSLVTPDAAKADPVATAPEDK